MPISASACPAAAPPVTSLRPSRLATRTTGAPVRSPGTVMPAGGVPSLADAVLTVSVADTATAARTAPMPRNRRRLVLLVMVFPSIRPTPGASAGSSVRARHPDARPGFALQTGGSDGDRGSPVQRIAAG